MTVSSGGGGWGLLLLMFSLFNPVAFGSQGEDYGDGVMTGTREAEPILRVPCQRAGV